MIVAGVGFSSNCAAEELAELVRAAQAAVGRPAAALAAPGWKAGAACLQACAVHLALPVMSIPRPAMAALEDRLATRSTWSRAVAGVGSVAEACALAAAGPGARLILPRLASAHATCAISEGDPP